MMRHCVLAVGLAMVVSACQPPPPREPSQGHLSEPPPVTAAQIPAPVKRAPLILPPAPRQVQQTYTVVVHEVPVKELLFALARDALINMDVHPLMGGLVTLNAIDQTLEEILDRITGQLDIRYDRRNGVLVIEPDTPVLRSYRIDYVNMVRDVRSRSSTATQVAAGGDGQTSLGNNSSIDIDNLSSHRFWERMTTAVQAIVLGDSDRRSHPPDSEQTAESGGVVIPNPETGLLLVRATTRRHREIKAYIDDVLASARRQVLIEATIVEVELSDRYQAGVDWGSLVRSAGVGVQQRLLAGNLATAPFFTLGFQSKALGEPGNRLDLTVRLLEAFGNVQVLSSPKLVVLNNQTAVLKAIRNVVYFEVDVEVEGGTLGSSGTISVDTDARTAPEGVMLTVTPHVSHSGEIILNVRPTITRVNRFVNDPQPRLADAGVTNPVPELLVREMESMLRLQSGQVAVLGGLMQDNNQIDTDGVPVLSNLDTIGEAFKFRNNNFIKTELVVFIRPRIIQNPSIDVDLQDFERYLPANLEAGRPIGASGKYQPAAVPP